MLCDTLRILLHPVAFQFLFWIKSIFSLIIPSCSPLPQFTVYIFPLSFMHMQPSYPFFSLFPPLKHLSIFSHAYASIIPIFLTISTTQTSSHSLSRVCSHQTHFYHHFLHLKFFSFSLMHMAFRLLGCGSLRFMDHGEDLIWHIFLFIKDILKGKSIPTFEAPYHGTVARDFTYIDDIVKGGVVVVSLEGYKKLFTCGHA